MIRLVGIELLKLRTIRLGYWLAAVPAGLTIIFSALEASRAAAPAPAGSPR